MKRAQNFTVPERTEIHLAALRRMPSGSSMADAVAVVSAVLDALPAMHLGGMAEISELWTVPRSTAMERVRRLGDAFPDPVAAIRAATLYDLDEIARSDWTPRKAGRPRRVVAEAA
jgi:hypothetical protein